MSGLELPDGAYLGWRYVDSHRSIDRSQLYHDDGRVEAIESDEHSELCRFSAEQVVAAKRAIVDSGLAGATDVAGDDVSDAAPVVYAWRVEGSEGSIVNRGYPQLSHPEIDRLDEALARIEEAAGCWPLMADEGDD